MASRSAVGPGKFHRHMRDDYPLARKTLAASKRFRSLGRASTVLSLICIVAVGVQVLRSCSAVATFVGRGVLCRGATSAPCSSNRPGGRAQQQSFSTALRAIIPLEDLVSGEEFEGTVKIVWGDGVGVDIGSEVSGFVGRGSLGKDLGHMKVGDKVRARVVRVREVPKQRRSNGPFRQRLELTMRSDTTPVNQFSIGEKVRGKIEKVARWGAFVEIGSDLSAMLPKAELQDKRVYNTMKEGGMIDAWVRGVGLQDGRVQLTTRNLEAGLPPDIMPVSDFWEGTVCKGVVMVVKPEGLFIDVGTKEWAFAHIREVNNGLVGKLSALFRPQQVVTVQVSRNDGQRLNLRIDDPDFAADLTHFQVMNPERSIKGVVDRKVGDKAVIVKVSDGNRKAFGYLDRRRTKLGSNVKLGSKVAVYVVPRSEKDMSEHSEAENMLYLTMYTTEEWFKNSSN